MEKLRALYFHHPLHFTQSLLALQHTIPTPASKPQNSSNTPTPNHTHTGRH